MSPAAVKEVGGAIHARDDHGTAIATEFGGVAFHRAWHEMEEACAGVVGASRHFRERDFMAARLEQLREHVREPA